MATKVDYDYTRTWPINPDAPAHSDEVKAPHIEEGYASIPPERYFTEAWAALERERLWSKVWTWAGRDEDIADPGDFLRFDHGRESFLIIRGHDDGIRAFYNVCPHRGNRLVAAETGSLSNAITCPFHNWRFGFDGTLESITDRETFRPEALCANFDLSEVRCESWEGFIFINVDENATPLVDHLGPLAKHALPYKLRDMRIMRRVQSVWESNWKVGVDGFNEAYHVHAIHPQILPIFNDYHAQIDLYPNGMSRMVTKFAYESPRLTRVESEPINAALRATLTEVGLDPSSFEGRMEDVRPAVQKAKRERAKAIGLDYSGFIDNQLTDDWNYTIFPNIQIGMHPEGLSMLYFRPHPSDTRKHILDVIVMMHPQTDPVITPPAYMGLPDDADLSGNERVETQFVDWWSGGLGELFDQDAGLFKAVQEGLESKGYRGGVLSEQEQRIRHFHKELDRYVLAQ